MIHRTVKSLPLCIALMALAAALPLQAEAKTMKFKPSKFSEAVSGQESTRSPAWIGAPLASSGAVFYSPVRLKPGEEITDMRIWYSSSGGTVQAFLNYVDDTDDPPDTVTMATASTGGATASPTEPVMLSVPLELGADPIIRRGRKYYLVTVFGGGSVLWQVNLSYNP